MGKLTKAFKLIFWPAVFGMGVALMAIGIYDRFSDDDYVRTFYSDRIDATCLTTTVQGKPVIWCFDGDRTAAVEDEQ